MMKENLNLFVSHTPIIQNITHNVPPYGKIFVYKFALFTKGNYFLT